MAELKKNPNYTDDELIAITQNIRMDMVSDLIEGGMPDNNKDRNALLRVLEQVDTTAVQNKRIDTEDKNADEDRRVAEYNLLLRRNLLKEFAGGVEPDNNPIPPAPELPPVEVLPGETDFGVSHDTYDK